MRKETLVIIKPGEIITVVIKGKQFRARVI